MTKTTTGPAPGRHRPQVSRGTMVEAAKRLGISPQALNYRIRTAQDPLAMMVVEIVETERQSRASGHTGS